MSLTESLDRLRPYLIEVLRSPSSEQYRAEEDYGYFSGQIPENTDAVRLRLDIEFTDHYTRTTPVQDLADIMITSIRNDVGDILENGDVESSDPLLRLLDGRRTRGKEYKSVEIIAARVVSSHKEYKSSTEYQVFLVLVVEW